MLASLSIVVPAFNEAESIDATVNDALKVGAMVARELEVLVLNDGSRDGFRAGFGPRDGAAEVPHALTRLRGERPGPVDTAA